MKIGLKHLWYGNLLFYLVKVRCLFSGAMVLESGKPLLFNGSLDCWLSLSKNLINSTYFFKSKNIWKSKSLYCILLPYVAVLSWRYHNIALEIVCLHIILKEDIFIETQVFNIQCLTRLCSGVFALFSWRRGWGWRGKRGWIQRSPCPLGILPFWSGLCLVTGLPLLWYPLAQVYTILHSLSFTFEQLRKAMAYKTLVLQEKNHGISRENRGTLAVWIIKWLFSRLEWPALFFILSEIAPPKRGNNFKTFCWNF